MSRQIKRSTYIPALLLVYLGAMSYIGRGELQQGHYMYYFGTTGATLIVIIALHFILKRRERLASERKKSSRRRMNA